MSATLTVWNVLPYEEMPELAEVDTVVRQSTIGQMQMCPAREGYSNTPGFLEPVSERMCFGTCAHYLFSETILAGEARLDMLSNMGEWVDKVLREDYDWSLEQVDKPQQFLDELSVAYRIWYKEVYPQVTIDQPLAVEQEMYLLLGEGTKGNIWLRGTADLVLPTTVVDWKTSGKAWDKGKAHLSIQASLYLPLARQNVYIPHQNFTFWVYDRGKSSWDKHETSRTEEEMNAALLTAYNYGLQIEAGIFPATPVPEAKFPKARGWYCKPTMCGAWNVCEAKFMNDGVDEQQVAVRSWT